MLDKYKAKGCTIHTLDGADILANRPKAVAAWQAATKDNPLAKKILDQPGCLHEAPRRIWR